LIGGVVEQLERLNINTIRRFLHFITEAATFVAYSISNLITTILILIHAAVSKRAGVFSATNLYPVSVLLSNWLFCCFIGDDHHELKRVRDEYWYIFMHLVSPDPLVQRERVAAGNVLLVEGNAGALHQVVRERDRHPVPLGSK